MKIIRTVAVGLLISAFLIHKLSLAFITWLISESPAFAGQMAWRTMTESVANTAGVGVILPAAFITFCFGIGLAIAGTFYPLSEDFLVNAYNALAEHIVSYNKKHYGWGPTEDDKTSR